MSVSQATKLRWFDQGADAFAQSLPNALTNLGTNRPLLYVCPLCIEPAEAAQRVKFRLFTKGAVASGLLTAEHVPPLSFRGRELLLTCATCNHTAGAGVDAEARKRENSLDALTGRATKPVAVRLTAGGHRLPARLWTEGETHEFKVAGGFKPGSDDAFRDVISGASGGDREIHVEFYADRYSERRARISWLRSSYLVLFAVLGYRYVFHPGIALVRRQIRDPDVEHIPTFLCTLPGDHPWTERRIIKVLEPEWQQCWAVQVGRYVAFLPKFGDTELYDRIADARRKGVDQAVIRGDSFEWPTRPSFGVASPQP